MDVGGPWVWVVRGRSMGVGARRGRSVGVGGQADPMTPKTLGNYTERSIHKKILYFFGIGALGVGVGGLDVSEQESACSPKRSNQPPQRGHTVS